MRSAELLAVFTTAALVVLPTAARAAQEPPPATRAAAIVEEQAEKSKTLQPMEPGKAERAIARTEGWAFGSGLKLHPFFGSAYLGGGFPFGAGYKHFVSPHNTIDVRGSYSSRGYKRFEAEFEAPHLFHRRGQFTVLAGYREATQGPFFGLGMDSLEANRVHFGFQQPFAQALLAYRPNRRHLALHGGFEWMRWQEIPGSGDAASIDTRYTPETLPGVGADVEYLHSQAQLAFDWRPAPGYARRGGFYAVTAHDYTDRNDEFGFERLDAEIIQHAPILREAWTISLRAHTSTTHDKDAQQIPYFFLPTVGGGNDLRGWSSYRFRDRNSILFQAEWRIQVNRFLDTAFFYDAGKVTARTRDLGFTGLEDDYGFGVRFHGPTATALRIDLARSRDGLRAVFASSHVF
jgi:hypothetical protein